MSVKTEVTAPAAPASTVLHADRSRVRTIKGQKIQHATCRFCDNEQPVDAEHFFPHKRSGGYHVNSRCRSCEGDYRKGLRTEENRVIVTRGGIAIDWDAAKAVYEYVLNNWAVKRAEIITGTSLDEKVVNKTLKRLEGDGLLTGTKVNEEKAITYQTGYDVENDKTAKREGKKTFAAWMKAQQEQAAAKDAPAPAETPATETTDAAK